LRPRARRHSRWNHSPRVSGADAGPRGRQHDGPALAPIRTTSDAEGRFSVGGLGRVRSRSKPIIPDTAGRRWTRRRWRRGAHREVTLRFERPGSLAGLVRWHDGTPAAGTRVLWRSMAGVRAIRRPSLAPTAASSSRRQVGHPSRPSWRARRSSRPAGGLGLVDLVQRESGQTNAASFHFLCSEAGCARGRHSSLCGMMAPAGQRARGRGRGAPSSPAAKPHQGISPCWRWPGRPSYCRVVLYCSSCPPLALLA
jgi:hypothetical protein